jgi:hypothetical protein
MVECPLCGKEARIAQDTSKEWSYSRFDVKLFKCEKCNYLFEVYYNTPGTPERESTKKSKRKDTRPIPYDIFREMSEDAQLDVECCNYCANFCRKSCTDGVDEANKYSRYYKSPCPDFVKNQDYIRWAREDNAQRRVNAMQPRVHPMFSEEWYREEMEKRRAAQPTRRDPPV